MAMGLVALFTAALIAVGVYSFIGVARQEAARRVAASGASRDSEGGVP